MDTNKHKYFRRGFGRERAIFSSAKICGIRDKMFFHLCPFVFIRGFQFLLK